MSNDPPRLFESDPAAREAIDAARSDAPDAKRLAKIGAAAAAAATVTGAASAASASAGTALATKIVVGVVFVGAVVGVGGYVASQSSPAPSVSASVSVSASAPAASVAVTATATATASVAASASASVAATASVSASVSVAATASAHPSPVGPDGDQMEILDQAQKALASDPAKALSLCDKDAVANPKGSMAQEREVLAIDALMRLKRTDDAKARAQRFHAAWPDSAHGRRVDALLNLH